MRPLRLDDRGFCSPIRLRKDYVSVLKKIQKAKRGCNATRTFRKNRKARNTGLVLSGRLYGDTNEDFWTMFNDEQKSYLSKCVTSITLCNGESTLFSCSGIAIDQRNHLTRFLTSASLVRALNGATNKDYIVLKIAVRHEGNEVYEGRLAEYDLDQNFAIVNVYAFLDVHVGLKHVLEIPSHGELLLVALGRGISGKLIARTVMSSCDLRVSEDDEVLACENSEPWESGPLFSRDGIFVGMSLHSTMRRAFFQPWNTILEHLKQQPTLVSLKLFRFGPRPLGEKSSSHLEVYKRLNQEQLELDSMGYPKLPPTMSDAGMVLVHTFEETFGDIYGEGVWSKLSKKASSDLNCSVVALASYNGDLTEKKGCLHAQVFFIEWNGSTVILTSASLVRSSGDENKIVENLRIEVLLPHNRCIKGKLEDYCLHYNVAVVSVKDHHDCRPANVLVHRPSSCEVAAVGRCFKTGALMATTGRLVPWSGTLDCEFLIHSSCKITKAGIGGPLATMDGDVIGMNFYDRRVGTPFLSWECICNILRSLKGKSKEGEVGNDSDSVMYGRDSVMYGHTYTRRRRAQRTPTSLTDSFGAPFCKMAAADKDRLNRWPVPMPYWCHRDYMDGDKSDHDDDGCEYTYVNGEKFMLLF